MKVLSLLQPWATLVAIGAKKIETRSWNTFYRGPILIHASKGKSAGMNLWYLDPFDKYIHDFNSLPFGAIIGRAEIYKTDLTVIAEHKLLNEDFSTDEINFGDYSKGRHAWYLKNPVQFQNPIKAKGSISLWDHPDIHEEEIICPECGTRQWATVEHTIPWATFIHHCKICKYTIMESEWNKVEPVNTEHRKQ